MKKPVGNKTLVVVLVLLLLGGIYFLILYPLFSLFWLAVFIFLYLYDLKDFYLWKNQQLQRIRDWLKNVK